MSPSIWHLSCRGVSLASGFKPSQSSPGGMEAQRLKAAPVLASVVHAARGPAEVPQGMWSLWMIIGCHWIELAQAWIWNNLHLPNKLEPPKKRRTWLSAAVLAANAAPLHPAATASKHSALRARSSWRLPRLSAASACQLWRAGTTALNACLTLQAYLDNEYTHVCQKHHEHHVALSLSLLLFWLDRKLPILSIQNHLRKNGNVHRWRTCWHISC